MRASIIALVMVSLFSACNKDHRPTTPEERARLSIDTVSRTLVAVSETFTPLYDDRVDSCLSRYADPSAHRGEVIDCVGAYLAVARALDATRSAILAGEHAVDAVGASGWSDALPLVLEGLSDLVCALLAAGLDVPSDIAALVTRGEC